VSRVPVFGLGCAGGVSGLSIAARLAEARPGANVLLVALELCTLAVRHDELTKANIVAASLFGDGAAAIVLRAGDGGATRIEATGEKLWPDTLDIMGWTVDPEGFGVVFQRTIPDFVRNHVGPAIAEILARMQLTANDVDRFLCHPGGAKVIAALERALSLDQGTLDHERDVIAACGNMSGPTVLFVLERACAKGLPPRSLLTALGPRWTTRIVELPGAPLVASGPYRYFPHPNYAVVVGEIAVLPLALHLPRLALIFTLLNLAVLALRIRVENRALSVSDWPRTSTP
jgi:alkylresorcinol/alkylpyrone synthase